MRFTNLKKYTVISLILLYLSCVTITPADEYERVHGIEESLTNNKKQKSKKIRNTAQSKIVEAALKSCDMAYVEKLNFSGKKFNNDCSGLIYGIFWEADIDLVSYIVDEKGNGVRRLYSALKKKGLIHKEKHPKPGDLIFWDNTYGQWGSNPLSHIGVVISVDDNGNIEYVHNNTYLGAIRKERMNLYKPHENRPTNNYMRYDNNYKKTAGELFNSFGSAWKL